MPCRAAPSSPATRHRQLRDTDVNLRHSRPRTTAAVCAHSGARPPHATEMDSSETLHAPAAGAPFSGVRSGAHPRRRRSLSHLKTARPPTLRAAVVARLPRRGRTRLATGSSAAAVLRDTLNRVVRHVRVNKGLVGRRVCDPTPPPGSRIANPLRFLMTFPTYVGVPRSPRIQKPRCRSRSTRCWRPPRRA